VSGISAACRYGLAITRSLVCFTDGGHGPARIPCTDSRCFCRRVLITLVMPLHRPGSANASASVSSVCLYREQERSLTSDGGPGVSHTRRLGASQQSRPPIMLHVCVLTVLTHAPRRRRPDLCPPFCTPVLPRCRPIVQRV